VLVYSYACRDNSWKPLKLESRLYITLVLIFLLFKKNVFRRSFVKREFNFQKHNRGSGDPLTHSQFVSPPRITLVEPLHSTTAWYNYLVSWGRGLFQLFSFVWSLGQTRWRAGRRVERVLLIPLSFFQPYTVFKILKDKPLALTRGRRVESGR